MADAKRIEHLDDRLLALSMCRPDNAEHSTVHIIVLVATQRHRLKRVVDDETYGSFSEKGKGKDCCKPPAETFNSGSFIGLESEIVQTAWHMVFEIGNVSSKVLQTCAQFPDVMDVRQIHVDEAKASTS